MSWVELLDRENTSALEVEKEFKGSGVQRPVHMRLQPHLVRFQRPYSSLYALQP